MTHRRSDQGMAGGNILRRSRAHLAGAAVDGRDHSALSCRWQRHQRGVLARCLQPNHVQQMSGARCLQGLCLQRQATLYRVLACPNQVGPRLLPLPLMFWGLYKTMFAAPNNV